MKTKEDIIAELESRKTRRLEEIADFDIDMKRTFEEIRDAAERAIESIGKKYGANPDTIAGHMKRLTDYQAWRDSAIRELRMIESLLEFTKGN